MKKFMILMLMALMISPMVSGFEFDNVKRFDNVGKYGRVHIDNFFGLGSRLITIDLIENTDFCAEQCEAILELQLFSDQEDILNNLRLRKYRGGSWDEDVQSDSLVSYIQTGVKNVRIDNYKNVCTSQLRDGVEYNICVPTIRGKRVVSRPVWTLWDGGALATGNYTVKVVGQKGADETVDWIPTFLGREVSEWVVWSGYRDNTDKDFFYRMNSGNGAVDVIDEVGAQPGLFVAAPTWQVSDFPGFVNQSRGTGSTTYFNNSFNVNGTAQWTLEFRFNASADTDDYVMSTGPDFAFGCDVARSGILLHRAPGGLDFSTCDHSTYNTVSPPITTNAATHMVWVYQRGACGVYIDGVLVSNYTSCAAGTTANGASGDNMLWFNRLGSKAGKNFLGALDQIVFWNRHLTGAEILSANASTGDGSGPISDEVAITVNLTDPLDGAVIGSDSQVFNATFNQTGANFTNGTVYIFNSTGDIFNNTVINILAGNETNSTTWEIANLFSGNFTWNAEVCGENSTDSSCAFAPSNFSFSLDLDKPLITLTTPTEGENFTSFTSNLNVSFNVTVSDDFLNVCWYNSSDTATITTYTCNTEENVTFTSGGRKIIWFFVNDTGGNENETNVTVDTYLFTTTQTDTPDPVGEGGRNNISLVVDVDGPLAGTFPVQGSLYWNNTVFGEGTRTVTGNSTLFENIFVVPNASGNSSGAVITWLWEINATPLLENTNTSSQTQLVITPSISDCSAFPIVIINYSLIDEGDQSLLGDPGQNTTIEFDITLRSTLNNSITFTLSGTNGTNPHAICMNDKILNQTSYRMDVLTRYVATDHVSEFHNIQNFLLNNNTIPQNIKLFDLAINDSQEFLITVKDKNLLPLEDALVDITRKYISEGVFKSVEVPKTDTDGETIGHLVLSDVIYSLFAKVNGTIVASLTDVVAICENQATGDCKLIIRQLVDRTETINFTTQDNVNFNLSIDKGTRIVRAFFTTIDGANADMNLTVTVFDAFSNTTACDQQLTSSSGSLECTIPATFGNTSVLVQLSSSGNSISRSVFSLQQDLDAILGLDRFIATAIMVMTLPLMMISSGIGIVVGVLLGLSMAILLQFVGGGIILTSTSIMWIVVAGGILIFKITRRD